MRTRILLPLSSLLAFVISSNSMGEEPKLKAMILHGDAGFHGVAEATNAFKAMLRNTGRFDVRVETEPNGDPSGDNWGRWNPHFASVDVVVLNTFAEHWNENQRDQLVAFVRNGGGLVVYHMVLAAFDGNGVWESIFDEMIGLGWNVPDRGTHVIFSEEKSQFVGLPPYIGPGLGHGKRHEFTVDCRAPDHPIMRNMPDAWVHGQDELYHGMRGPAKNLTVLATAYSSKEHFGSGDHEPVAWTVEFGKGRIFATVLGHQWPENFSFTAGMGEDLKQLLDAEAQVGMNPGENGNKSLRCVGFQTLFVRGTEWAASNDVTLPVPVNFPTTTQSSSVAPSELKWLIP